MTKQHLLQFLEKYHLNGQGDNSVLIDFGEDHARVIFYGIDRSFIGFVQINESVNLGKIGIFQTDVFMRMLTAFDDGSVLDIIPHKRPDGIVHSLGIKSGNVEANVTTADPEIIPKVNLDTIDTEQFKLKTEPSFDFDITFNNEFVTAFKRYSNASSADIFALEAKGLEYSIIMNYSMNNVNHIRFTLDSRNITTNVVVSPDREMILCFSVAIFNEIFNANKINENTKCWMGISADGMCKMHFTDDLYSSTYYIVATDHH